MKKVASRLLLLISFAALAADADLLVDVSSVGGETTKWTFCGCAVADSGGLVGGSGVMAGRWNLGETMKDVGRDRYFEPASIDDRFTLCTSRAGKSIHVHALHAGYDEIAQEGTFSIATDFKGHIPIKPGDELCWKGHFHMPLEAASLPEIVEGSASLAGLALNFYNDGETHCHDSVNSVCAKIISI
jgi:hypothetical protein